MMDYYSVDIREVEFNTQGHQICVLDNNEIFVGAI